MFKKGLIFSVFFLFVGIGIILSTSMALKQDYAPIGRDTYYVGGSGPGNYSSIQDAIDDAFDGDTVFVYAYSSPYYENVVVDKSINLIGEDKETTLIDGSGSVNTVSVLSDNSVIKNFQLIKGTNGLYLNNSDFNNISNCLILENTNGIYLNTFCYNNNFYNNFVENNSVGIYLFDECKWNTFYSNFIENNFGDGFHLHYGGTGDNNDFNSFLNNSVCFNSGDGVDVGSTCSGNVLDGNVLDGNVGFGVRLIQLDNYVYRSNTVLGESVHYFYDVHGTVDDPVVVEDQVLTVENVVNKAKVYVYRCSNISIRNCTFENGSNVNVCLDSSENVSVDGCVIDNQFYGILLIGSDFNVVSNCSIFGSSYGVYLQSYCSNNVFFNNSVVGNSLEGFYLQFRNDFNWFVGNFVDGNSVGFFLFDECKWNLFEGNVVVNCSGDGFHLHYDGGSGRDNNDLNKIYENIIKDNSARGLYIGSTCNNNKIFSNNFINNTENTYDESSNSWNELYPIGGNFWEDYSGSDSNGDGLGDTPYNISGGSNIDNYPLILKWGENPPVANFTYVVYNLSVLFNGSSSYDRDGEIIEYTFNFGDGNVETGMVRNHTYIGYGTYFVSLNVIDNDGKSDDTSKICYVKIHLSNLDPKWNLISLPFNQSVIKSNITVLYNGSEYTWNEAVNESIILSQIYQWNRTNQNYDLVNVLSPGHGYWTYSYKNCEMRAIVKTNLSYNRLITDLLFEWNLVGLPDNKNVHKENITVYYNEEEYTWQQAVSNNIILDYVYLWDKIDQNYKISDYLVSEKACWMYAFVDCRLLKPS